MTIGGKGAQWIVRSGVMLTGVIKSWQAVCVDYDLAVYGNSFQDVKRALETSLEMFLEAVAELPPEERSILLARKAPWYVRAKLAGMTWLYRTSWRRPSISRVRHSLPAPSTSLAKQPSPQTGLPPDRRQCGPGDVVAPFSDDRHKSSLAAYETLELPMVALLPISNKAMLP